jgi:hypothetical protein
VVRVPNAHDQLGLAALKQDRRHQPGDDVRAAIVAAVLLVTAWLTLIAGGVL